MAARIQRKRTPGWKLPAGAIIVDRTSRWGNPFRVDGSLVELIDGRTLACGSPASARKVAVEQYGAWLDGEGPDVIEAGRKKFDRRKLLAVLPQMRGHDLACPCDLPEPDQPDHCHAAEQIRRANVPRSSTPDVKNPDGSTSMTVQRCCNGCGEEIGDVTDWEMSCAVAGRLLPDVRGECPTCTPAERPLSPVPAADRSDGAR